MEPALPLVDKDEAFLLNRFADMAFYCYYYWSISYYYSIALAIIGLDILGIGEEHIFYELVAIEKSKLLMLDEFSMIFNGKLVWYLP